MSIDTRDITVQQDNQEHYIIYDRVLTQNTEPPFNENVLVTNDNNSNRLYFNMFYTFDDRELENKDISIVWINANGDKGETPCGDKTLDGDRLYFSWNVPLAATQYAGDITFAVHITTDNYKWNSLPTTIAVRQGLITDEYNELPNAETYQGWTNIIDNLQSQITALTNRIAELERQLQ